MTPKKKTTAAFDDEDYFGLNEPAPRSPPTNEREDEDYFGLDEPAPLPRPNPDKCNCKYNRWPATVPILAAADLWWNYSHRNRRFDLLMWLDITFDSDSVFSNPKRERARRMLERVLAERLHKAKADLWKFLESAQKEKSPSLAWQAACWNEAMLRLGFDIPVEQCGSE